MWGSPEKPGGLGSKFERAYISEIIGVDALIVDRRAGFRVDPLGASSKVAVVPNGEGGFHVIGEDQKVKNAQRPSQLNHGNVVFDSTNGGVRCRYAEQTTVVSFGALRKLRFPIDGKTDPTRDNAARTVLAAIGIAAGVLAAERGVSLRSRCHLIPTAPRTWELLDRPGEPPAAYTINSKTAIALLNDAATHAKTAGLSWMEQRLVLEPSAELIELVRRSQEVATTEDDQEG
jgi:CRISPR-associated protein Csb1